MSRPILAETGFVAAEESSAASKLVRRRGSKIWKNVDRRPAEPHDRHAVENRTGKFVVLRIVTVESEAPTVEVRNGSRGDVHHRHAGTLGHGFASSSS